MAVASYERLSGLDESFLGFETPNAPMHVAVTAIFEHGPVCRPGGGVDIERLRRRIEARLPRLARFRQRLGYIPLVRDAVWVDAADFDVDRHVRHTSLPRPGSRAQLEQRCAEIMERPLNRRHPLWEAWIVEGLADEAFALVVKVHHCIVDGIAGIGMLAALLDPGADEPAGGGDAWRPRPTPTTGELLRDEVARRARATVAIGRAIGQTLGDPTNSLTQMTAAGSGLWRLIRTTFSPAPAASINQPIGPHRQLAWLDLDLGQVKAVKERLGGTVNDVVLTLVSGALGSALRRRGELPQAGHLRAAVPVSVRAAEEFGAPGNRVSVWLVPLPVGERDPLRRHAAIRATTAELKRSQQAAGGAALAGAANWASGTLVEMAARLINAARIYKSDRDQRAGAERAALHGRFAHAGGLPAPAAVRAAGRRHSPPQLCRTPPRRHGRGLGRRRPAGSLPGAAPGRIRRSDDGCWSRVRRSARSPAGRGRAGPDWSVTTSRGSMPGRPQAAARATAGVADAGLPRPGRARCRPPRRTPPSVGCANVVRVERVIEMLAPAYESHNEIRLAPRDGEGQRLVAFRLDVEPAGALLAYDDAYGNRVHALSVNAPHEVLTIVARSGLERVAAPAARVRDLTVAEFLADDSARSSEQHEFLSPTVYVPFSDPLRRFFWSARPRGSRRCCPARAGSASTPPTAASPAGATCGSP